VSAMWLCKVMFALISVVVGVDPIRKLNYSVVASSSRILFHVWRHMFIEINL
jgi:hypothetical protein